MRPASTSSAARLLVLLGLAVTGVLSAATAASVYVATEPPRRAAHVGPPMLLTDTMFASRYRALTALVDSVVAPLGTSTPLDSARLAAFVARTATAGRPAAWIAEPDSRAHPTSPLVVTDEDVAVYRAWARSARLPTFWGYRRGFGAPQEVHQIPIRRFAVLKALWQANAAAADSALVHGEMEEATERALENLAGARHLLGQPFLIDAMMGRVQLKEAAKLLARVALQAEAPQRHSAADRLLSMAQAMDEAPRGSWVPVLRAAADPALDSLVRLAADTSAHPARRLFMAELLPSGACFNPREMLFGVSAERRAAMVRLFAALADIPRVSELQTPFLRLLDLADGAAPIVRPPRHGDLVDRVLEAVLPDGVTARRRWCRGIAENSGEP